MYTYASVALIIGLVIGIVYRRILLRIAYWTVMAIGIVFAYRVASLVDTRLADTSHLWYPIIGGLTGFVVIGVLCIGHVRRLLIWFYLQRAIQRDRAAANEGRLW